MWTKILIFMVVFFLVANPATFKIMRGLLGSWVAGPDGHATPAGLILHGAVFVALAIFLPKALMRASGYEDEDYEDEDYEEEDYEDDGEGYEDDGEGYEEEDYEDGEEYEDDEGFRRRRCRNGSYYSRRLGRRRCRRCRRGFTYDRSKPRGQRCVPVTPVVVAPGASAPAPVSAPAVAATPVVTVPVSTTPVAAVPATTTSTFIGWGRY